MDDVERIAVLQARLKVLDAKKEAIHRVAEGEGLAFAMAVAGALAYLAWETGIVISEIAKLNHNTN